MGPGFRRDDTFTARRGDGALLDRLNQKSAAGIVAGSVVATARRHFSGNSPRRYRSRPTLPLHPVAGEHPAATPRQCVAVLLKALLHRHIVAQLRPAKTGCIA